MKSMYKHIFEPLTIRRMTMKNRIMMTPMGTNYGEQSGEMSFLHINYYEQRARGGTGLIMVENANVDYPLGSNGTTQLRIDHDNYLPRLFKLTETVHKHGACIGIQINHAGASAQSARTQMQPVSASDIPSKAGGEIPRPLEKEEILQIVKKYGQAAKRAQAAGFDTVEIHAGHSYLISQFLSPLTNHRTDEFGGSAENRARFARMVLEEVRAQVGPHFPIFVRISADEFLEGGNTLEDTLDYLQYFQEEADVIDVSAGLNSSIQYQIDANYLPDGWRSYMAKAVKERYGKPCVTTGNIRNPQVAEDILAKGDADIIGMGRGLIADPDWVNKVEFGDVCDIRKCISCNIGCAGNRIGINRPIRCTVNPAVLHGEVYKKQRVSKPCNVVVIGGGTAGLEAACTAAEVGCTTFLIEKKPYLGGLAAEISKIPDKKRLADFIYSQEEDRKRCLKDLTGRDMKQFRKRLDHYLDILLMIPFFQGQSEKKRRYVDEKSISSIPPEQRSRRFLYDREKGKYYTEYDCVPKLLLINERLYEEYGCYEMTETDQENLDRLVADDVHYIINIQGSSGVDCAYLVEKDEDLCIKLLDRLKGSGKFPLKTWSERRTV